MLIRTDPFRELDRLAQQVIGTRARPAAMPLDAWREGEQFVVEFDLPGMDPGSIDLDVERNVLTVRAERLRIPFAEKAKPRKIEISSRRIHAATIKAAEIHPDFRGRNGRSGRCPGALFAFRVPHEGSSALSSPAFCQLPEENAWLRGTKRQGPECLEGRTQIRPEGI